MSGDPIGTVHVSEDALGAIVVGSAPGFKPRTVVSQLENNAAMFDANVALVRSLVGCTIVGASWVDDDPIAHDGIGCEVATLRLDDGRVIQFGGYGYDVWGATVEDVTP